MDDTMEWSSDLREIGRNLPLLSKILDKCENGKLLSITKSHVNTLLKYTEKVVKMGPAAFDSKEEYQEFAIAKFYVDKCLDSFKSKSKSAIKEVEEGEIGSDSEAENQIAKPCPVKINEKIPPLEAFHLSPLERKKRLHSFWKEVKEGELYNAKVFNITNLTYDLLIVNKHLKEERLIDLTINACMKKSSCTETLQVSDIVRVSVVGFTVLANSIYKLVVTADKAELKVKIEKEIKLGKITEAELPFPPIETSKFRSLTQFFTAHYPDRDPAVLLKDIKALEIDPYKAYCFHPELDGKRSLPKANKEKAELTDKQLQSIKELKQALILKERKQFKNALIYANRAIELNPEYDLAYVIRASLYVRKADVESSNFLSSGIEDYLKALKLNNRNYPAIKAISHFLLRSANKFSDTSSFSESRKCLETARHLENTQEIEKRIIELNIYEQIHQSRERSGNN